MIDRVAGEEPAFSFFKEENDETKMVQNELDHGGCIDGLVSSFRSSGYHHDQQPHLHQLFPGVQRDGVA